MQPENENESVKCACCQRALDSDRLQNEGFMGDERTDYEGKALCETCYDEDEVMATLRVFCKDDNDDGGEYEYGENVFTLGSCRNMTSDYGYIGLWRTRWVRTDGWRGYYQVIPPADWAEFHSDCSLLSSYDSAQLQKFDEVLRGVLTGKDIRLVRAVTRTSNCCSSGVDYFVERKNLEMAKSASERLSELYRDPARFNITALTGKDPRDWKPEDVVMGMLGSAMLASKEPRGRPERESANENL